MFLILHCTAYHTGLEPTGIEKIPRPSNEEWCLFGVSLKPHLSITEKVCKWRVLVVLLLKITRLQMNILFSCLATFVTEDIL